MKKVIAFPLFILFLFSVLCQHMNTEKELKTKQQFQNLEQRAIRFVEENSLVTDWDTQIYSNDLLSSRSFLTIEAQEAIDKVLKKNIAIVSAINDIFRKDSSFFLNAYDEVQFSLYCDSLHVKELMGLRNTCDKPVVLMAVTVLQHRYMNKLVVYGELKSFLPLCNSGFGLDTSKVLTECFDSRIDSILTKLGINCSWHDLLSYSSDDEDDDERYEEIYNDRDYEYEEYDRY